MTQAQGRNHYLYNAISGPGGSHTGRFGRPTILMNQADPKGGGSGGSGNSGAGAGGTGGEGGEGGENALTEAQQKAVADMVNQAVTGAVTNHLGRFKKQFSEDMGKTLSETLGPISQQLKDLAERGTQQQANGKHKEESHNDAIRAMELRYESRIKELETANKAEREAREQEKQTRLREEERGKLANVLRERGIPDAQIRAAVALLHTEDKKVARSEDGRIVFKVERGTGAAKYTDELDVDKGVDEWLKSDEGKAYIPARQAAGSGGQPARPGSNNPQDKKAQATSDLAKILLGGGV